MTNRMPHLVAAVLTAAVLVVASVPAAAQDTERAYTWYGRLVSLDQSTRTLTTAVQLRDPLPKYVGRYTSGERIVLSWIVSDGEGDTAISAATPEQMKHITAGYILPVEFVSLDAGARTATIKTIVPADAVPGLTSAKPGQWMKVTASMD